MTLPARMNAYAFTLPSLKTAACTASDPVVSFVVGANPYSFTDTGQILNTGGWDFVNNSYAGEDGNESINWNAIGSAPVRGGTPPPIPEPSTYALFGLGLAAVAFAHRRRANLLDPRALLGFPG